MIAYAVDNLAELAQLVIKERTALRLWISMARHLERCRVHRGEAPCTCGRDDLLAGPPRSLGD